MWDEYVTTTCSRSTAALFLPSQVLDTTHPVLAPPLHFLIFAASLQVVSFRDDATLSRSVRPSTRPRRGRHGSGQSPRSASLVTTRRADAGKESSDSGCPQSEASGGCSQHSRGRSVPKEEQQKLPTPKVEEAPSDLGARWQRQSAPSSEHQRLVPPRSMGTRRLGASPTPGPRTDSPSVTVLVDRARRRHTVARDTT